MILNGSGRAAPQLVHQMTTLCATFRKEAGAVWKRMASAAQIGIALSEETITETTLYSVALAQQGNNIVVNLASKPAEAKHGADWEWWFVKGGKGRHFRVQAKRLFPDASYSSLLKKGNAPFEQLDKLVASAFKVGAEPLYCFYNFAAASHKSFGTNECTHSYNGPSFWGCSLGFPVAIRGANSNKFADLKKHLFPWHYLVCENEGEDILASTGRFVTESTGRVLPEPQALPDRVAYLVEAQRDSQKAARRSYLDFEYWSQVGSDGEGSQDVGGIVIFDDRR